MRRHDDSIFTLIAFGLIAVVVGISYLVTYIRRKKRTEALQLVANELGLTFSSQDSDQLVYDMGWCELFSRGRKKKIVNLMSGASDGRYVAVFDYQYVTGHGKSQRTWRTTVALLRSEGALLHRFSLRPKGTWDKISGLFGSAAIDFHNRPQFSRSYVLRGENQPGIRAMFTEEVLDYFEQRPGISAEGMIHTLLFYRPGKHVKPADVSQFLADAFAAQSLFRAVPESSSRI